MEAWPIYVANLRRLPSVRTVQAHPGPHPDWDGEIDISTDFGHASFGVDEKRGAVNHAMAERIISLRQRHPSQPWIVFSPYVTTRLGEQLRLSEFQTPRDQFSTPCSDALRAVVNRELCLTERFHFGHFFLPKVFVKLLQAN